MTEYDASALREERLEELPALLAERAAPAVTWINVANTHQPELVRRLGEVFGIHPLVQEDILNTDHRPKFEDHGQCLYVVHKVLDFNDERRELTAEQLSLMVGPNYLLSFQEEQGSGIFGPVRERLRANHGRLRGAGADHLAYALLDAVVDHYFLALEKLEDAMLSAPQPDALATILQLKRETLLLRHAVWPLRELVAAMQRVEVP